MIRVGKFALNLFAAAIVIAVADETDSNTTTIDVEMNETNSEIVEGLFVCDAICGNEKKGLSNPDFMTEYNWNSRVPVCAGLSCEEGTCAELELKLPTYFDNAAACTKHQEGLQAAGCECSGGSPLFGGQWWMAALVAAATTAAAGLL